MKSMLITAEFGKEIPSTGLTIGQVLHRLDACQCKEWHNFSAECNREILVKQCKIEPICGVGYLSCIWRLRFQIEEDGKAIEFKAIIKCPNPKYVAKVNLIDTKEELDFLFPLLVQFHNREVLFYSELLPKYLANSSMSNLLARPFAWQRAEDVHGLEQAFLLLEDLSELGKSPEEADNLSKEQIESVICAMAQVHAHSLAIPKSEMDELYLEETHLFKYSADTVIQRLCASESASGQFFSTNKGALEHFIADVLRRKANKENICAEFGIRPVLTHGDLWSSNLLFQIENPQKLTALLDWQFSHPNTGLNDLAHLLLGSVDVKLRLAHQKDWLRMYHAEMAKVAKAIGQTMPIEDIQQMEAIYQRHIPRELYFQMQMLVLNEAAGESKEHAQRRQLRLKEAFSDFIK